MQGVDYLKYGERLLVLAMVSAAFAFASWRSLMLGMEGKVWRSLARKPQLTKPHLVLAKVEPSMKALQSRAGIWREPMLCRRVSVENKNIHPRYYFQTREVALNRRSKDSSPGFLHLFIWSRSSVKVAVNSKSENCFQ